jgi:hypothetical protein
METDMKLLILAGLITLVGCTSIEKQQSNEQAQIEMVRVQREARKQEEVVESQEKAALYNAIAQIAATNPEHSPAALVALTAISMSSVEEDADAPILGLREQRNEALEWTAALAPTVGGLITGLGVAAINADVRKTDSNNSRKIQINDALTDAAIIESVAALGTAAVGTGGLDVGGDYYAVQDQGIIDNSTSQDTIDSYNQTTSDDDSSDTTLNYTASDNAFINAGVADYTDYIIDYQGSDMTLADLISSLNAAGAAYSIDLDGTTVAESDGDGSSTETVYVNCDAAQFSPKPPVCN